MPVIIGAAFRPDHHAAALSLGGAGGGHSGHSAGAAQQQGDSVPYSVLSQVGQGVGGGGALDGIGPSGDLHRLRRGGGGRQGLDHTHRPVRGDPQGPHGLIPVDHVVGLDGGEGGRLPVPGHRDAGEGEGDGAVPVAGGHQGAVHLPIHQGHQVYLSGGVEGVAQRGEIGLALLVFGGQEVIEQVHGVVPGEGGGGGLSGEAFVQTQAVVQGHLRTGIGAGVVLGGVAQKPQGDGRPLRQGDGAGRAEGAVGVAGDQPCGHAGFHEACGPVGIGHVRIGGGGGLAHLVALGAGLHGHGDEFGPGDGPGQAEIAAGVAGHDAQGGDDLGDLLLGGDAPRGKAGQGQAQGEAAGQQAGHDTFFHRPKTPFE